MKKIVPEEVIVVEGRDDTKRLIEVYGSQVRTIETNGSAISKDCLDQIKYAHQRFGVIVFTDPDYQGERIRRIITQNIPNVKHAYLSQEEAQNRKKDTSLGIEHAKPEVIISALNEIVHPQSAQGEEVPLTELIRLGLIANKKAANNRKKVSKYYKLGHVNGKQLQKKLKSYQITIEQLEKVLIKDGD